jgi:hypothetical protein
MFLYGQEWTGGNAKFRMVPMDRHQRDLVAPLWIDAVCINQDNEEEKEHQIQLMARIYSQANRLVVWLGETADDSDLALEEIRVARGKKSTDSSNNKKIQQAVLALLQRPWFRRMWVRERTLKNIRINY